MHFHQIWTGLLLFCVTPDCNAQNDIQEAIIANREPALHQPSASDPPPKSESGAPSPSPTISPSNGGSEPTAPSPHSHTKTLTMPEIKNGDSAPSSKHKPDTMTAPKTSHAQTKADPTASNPPETEIARRKKTTLPDPGSSVSSVASNTTNAQIAPKPSKAAKHKKKSKHPVKSPDTENAEYVPDVIDDIDTSPPPFGTNKDLETTTGSVLFDSPIETVSPGNDNIGVPSSASTKTLNQNISSTPRIANEPERTGVVPAPKDSPVAGTGDGNTQNGTNTSKEESKDDNKKHYLLIIIFLLCALIIVATTILCIWRKKQSNTRYASSGCMFDDSNKAFAVKQTPVITSPRCSDGAIGQPGPLYMTNNSFNASMSHGAVSEANHLKNAANQVQTAQTLRSALEREVAPGIYSIGRTSIEYEHGAIPYRERDSEAVSESSKPHHTAPKPNFAGSYTNEVIYQSSSDFALADNGSDTKESFFSRSSEALSRNGDHDFRDYQSTNSVFSTGATNSIASSVSFLGTHHDTPVDTLEFNDSENGRPDSISYSVMDENTTKESLSDDTAELSHLSPSPSSSSGSRFSNGTWEPVYFLERDGVNVDQQSDGYAPDKSAQRTTSQCFEL